MKDINAARGGISEVLSHNVIDTFNSMFGQDVSANRQEPKVPPGNVVVACVRLSQGNAHADFWFRFEMDLLLQAASAIFPADYIAENMVHESLACEIANIVCTKVKAFLNEQGYDTEMGFPFIATSKSSDGLARGADVDLHFFYQDKEQKKGAGVLVNFSVS
jgi:CheY-specific phosphatase CheX